jgi:hypothetical protein
MVITIFITHPSLRNALNHMALINGLVFIYYVTPLSVLLLVQDMCSRNVVYIQIPLLLCA